MVLGWVMHDDICMPSLKCDCEASDFCSGEWEGIFFLNAERFSFVSATPLTKPLPVIIGTVLGGICHGTIFVQILMYAKSKRNGEDTKPTVEDNQPLKKTE